MEEDNNGADGAALAKVSYSSFTGGGRQMYFTKVIPGETTFVSWKKFLKETAMPKASASSLQAPSNAHLALESRMDPGQLNKGQELDAPPANHRFSAVIEKIERLYMGKHSSDEEDMNDVPDDDEYDTEDSFIDDKELDEYFQVDNSAIKHDGFFINRGKLERIEPPSLPTPPPKKRKRKELKSQNEAEKCGLPNKKPKIRKKAAGKSDDLITTDISHLPIHVQCSVSCKDVIIESEKNVSQSCSREKSSATTTMLDKSTLSRVSNCDVGVSLPEEEKMDAIKKMGNVSHRSQNQKLKDRKSVANAIELDQSSQRKEKDVFREHPNKCDSEIKHPMQTAKGPLKQREASSTKPKSSMLDKAIKELENLVQESAKLSPVEVRDTDNVSQAVKRRLPWEVKQKLAKVARLAQTSQGKISKELVDRLMSILGHLVQPRTLKRNLNVMVKSGLSAKKEKDDRLDQIKKEVAEIIKLQIPHMKTSTSKAPEHQAGSSDDFQVTGNLEKDDVQKDYRMNEALENKLCDLYDLFIEGLELVEDAGPHARKLYMELSSFWPEGVMDNHGIKRAICRAKARKRALNSGQKGKKKLVKKSEVRKVVKPGAKPVVQSQIAQRKSAPAQLNKPILNATNTPSTSSQMAISSPKLDITKQDNKKKGETSNGTDPTVKKIMNTKQPLGPEEVQYSLNKASSSSLASSPLIEGHKTTKQLAEALQKPTIKPPPMPTAQSVSEQQPPNLSST